MAKNTTPIGQVVSLGNKRAAHVEVDITSYTANGESFDRNDAPIGSVERVSIVDNVTSNGYAVRYDESTGKFKAYHPTGSHSHDLLITGGQGVGDGIQVNGAVVGKTTATNVTATGGASNIQSKTSTASEVPAGTNVGKFFIIVYGVG